MAEGSGNVEAEQRAACARLDSQRKSKVVRRSSRSVGAREREESESKLFVVFGLFIVVVYHAVICFLVGVVWLITKVVTPLRAMEVRACRRRQSLSCSTGGL